MGGSPRVAVSPGQITPDLDWAGELACLTDASPYLGPAWLAAAEKTMPELHPWHTTATRARGELALAPGYILDSPAAVDHDPRTYLGWQAPAGTVACCGIADAETASGDLDAGQFYPVLLLGSPLGYRSEVAYNFWTPALMGTIASALVPAAFGAGVRSILAPWIPASRGNQALADALAGTEGGLSTFWGYEDFIRIDPGGWDTHLAALPPGKRRRISGDLRRAEEAGVRIERADGDGIRPHIARIAELTCLNREKNGAGEDPARIAGMVAALLDSGADVRAYLGFQAGALVASCVTIRKKHTLYLKWPGFDYAAIGEHSGVYFALVLDAPVRDACAEGLRTVEFGAGAHRAKALRGAQPRTVTTAMVLASPSLRQQAAARLDAFGRSRHAAFGDLPEKAPDAPATAGPGACCADG
jgi:Acetyltransferase (GNAT) domain